MNPIRVLLVDDHTVVREGTRQFGCVVQSGRDRERHTRLRPLDSAVVEMGPHHRVERVSESREIPDLLVMAGVTRYEERYYDDALCALSLEARHGVLEPVLGGSRAHQEAQLDRTAEVQRRDRPTHEPVPDVVAAVGDHDRSDLTLRPTLSSDGGNGCREEQEDGARQSTREVHGNSDLDGTRVRGTQSR